MLVGAIWDRAALEEGADDGEMAVGRGKVERGRAGRADDGCRGVTAALRVAAGESAGGGKRRQVGEGRRTWGRLRLRHSR